MSAVLNFDHEDYLHYEHPPLNTDLPWTDLKHELVTANNCGKLLGSGSFGHVYEIVNTDLVLKVCSTGDLKSDAYHSFLKIPLTQTTNPFLPRIEKFIRYQAAECKVTNNKDVVVYGVKMERLYSLDDTPKDALAKMGIELLEGFTTGDYYSERDPGYTIAYRIKSSYSITSFKGIKNLHLIEALHDIMAIQKKHKHYNDMGKSNFMVRHTLNWNTLSIDYQLVITDPLS